MGIVGTEIGTAMFCGKTPLKERILSFLFAAVAGTDSHLTAVRLKKFKKILDFN